MHLSSPASISRSTVDGPSSSHFHEGELPSKKGEGQSKPGETATATLLWLVTGEHVRQSGFVFLVQHYEYDD